MSKKFVLLSLLAILAISLTACNRVQVSFGGANAVVGSGKVVSETREVSGFTSVSVSGSGQAQITVGDSDSLVIEAEDNILPLIETSVHKRPAEHRLEAEHQHQHHARHPLHDHCQIVVGR